MTEQPPSASPGAITLADAPAESARLLKAAEALKVPLWMMGGCAVWHLCPSARKAPFARTYADIDFVTLDGKGGVVSTFLEAQGYMPERLFNALHGASRLTFMDDVHDRPLDVIIEIFKMCHKIDLRPGLLPGAPTISLTDLVLTKLQIVKLNEKDVADILALLLDHSPGTSDGIDLSRIVALTSSAWGFEHTIRATLAEVHDAVADYDLPQGDDQVIRQRIDRIVMELDRARKTFGWKARAAVGERLPWYELPEDVRH